MTVEEVFREKLTASQIINPDIFLMELLGDQATVVNVTPQTILQHSG